VWREPTHPATDRAGWWPAFDGDVAVRNEPGDCHFTVRLPRA
jgi:hypothetical protein